MVTVLFTVICTATVVRQRKIKIQQDQSQQLWLHNKTKYTIADN